MVDNDNIVSVIADGINQHGDLSVNKVDFEIIDFIL